MHLPSFGEILLILLVILILFGAGKLPSVMGDFGKGLRSFKAGLKGDGEEQDATKQVPTENKNS